MKRRKKKKMERKPARPAFDFLSRRAIGLPALAVIGRIPTTPHNQATHTSRTLICIFCLRKKCTITGFWSREGPWGVSGLSTHPESENSATPPPN